MAMLAMSGSASLGHNGGQSGGQRGTQQGASRVAVDGDSGGAAH